MLNCVRNPSLMTRRLDNCVYGLAYGLGLLAVAYLSQRWPQQFALWREVPATLIPTVAFSLPQTWEVRRTRPGSAAAGRLERRDWLSAAALLCVLLAMKIPPASKPAGYAPMEQA